MGALRRLVSAISLLVLGCGGAPASAPAPASASASGPAPALIAVPGVLEEDKDRLVVSRSVLGHQARYAADDCDTIDVFDTQQTNTTPPSAEVDSFLLIAETKTGDIRQRLALFRQADDTHQSSITFSPDGKTISYWNEDIGRGITFDLVTGAQLTP
jgi:hypothetical protein